MKVTLTVRQALNIITACEWAINDDYPESDPENQKWQRIINKLGKAVEEEVE